MHGITATSGQGPQWSFLVGDAHVDVEEGGHVKRDVTQAGIRLATPA